MSRVFFSLFELRNVLRGSTRKYVPIASRHGMTSRIGMRMRSCREEVCGVLIWWAQLRSPGYLEENRSYLRRRHSVTVLVKVLFSGTRSALFFQGIGYLNTKLQILTINYYVQVFAVFFLK